MAATDGQRKKPPTFKHLPKIRAQKLKKAWIENKKIKRRWRGQKEREGLLGQHELSAKDASEAESRQNRFDSSTSESRTAHNARDIATTPTSSQNDRPVEDLSGNQKSIRQLKRQAYSQSSLHTRKADSLQKVRGAGRGSPSKGQPDMKLRMNAMLEKIKRDFS